MKTIIKLIVLGVFLTGCGGNIFDILDDGKEETKQDEQNITMVTRDVKYEELVGTWVIEEESKKKYLKDMQELNSHYKKEENLKKLTEEVDLTFLKVLKGGKALFQDEFTFGKEYMGRAEIEDMKDLYEKNPKEKGKYLFVRYRRDGVTKWKDFYCIKAKGVFYLGEKYFTGDQELGDEKIHYLLYKIVKGATDGK